MKRKMYLPLLVATLITVGCATDISNLEVADFEKPSPISPEDIAAIEMMGFKSDDIYVTDDAYIVEEDIIIPKNNIDNVARTPKTRQDYYGVNYLVNRGRFNRNNPIKIAVIQLVPGSQYNALSLFKAQLPAAVKAFNDIKDFQLPLKVVEYSNLSGYDILIINGSLQNEIICASTIPNNGDPGNTIYVNIDQQSHGNWYISDKDKPRVSNSKIKTSLIHAIGHCLGLAHTAGAPQVTYPSAEGAASYHITDTSYTDGASIMNPQEHDFNYVMATTLSDEDKKALNKLYPAFAAGTISLGVQTVAVGAIPDKFTCSPAIGGVGPVNYRWQQSETPNIESSWSDIVPAVTTLTFQPPAAIKDIYYRVKVSSGQGTVYSVAAIVYVTLTGGSISGNQIVIPDATPKTLTSTARAAGGTGSYKYRWKQSSDNKTWKDVTNNGNAENYSPPKLTQTTYYQRTVSSGSRYAYSNSVTVICFNPVISGPDLSLTNNNLTYGLSNDSPDTATFYKWEIKPNTYTTTSGLNSRNLAIKFTAEADYTLTAHFTLPNGTTHAVTKKVEIHTLPMVAPKLDVMSGYLLSNQEAAMLGCSGNVYWVQPSSSGIFVSVSYDTYRHYAKYTWRSDYRAPQSVTNQQVQISFPSYSMLFPVMCAANATNYGSGWVTVWVYASATSPSGNMNQFKRAIKEAQEKYGDALSDK